MKSGCNWEQRAIACMPSWGFSDDLKLIAQDILQAHPHNLRIVDDDAALLHVLASVGSMGASFGRISEKRVPLPAREDNEILPPTSFIAV
jgi:hypothetical protein